jgi:transcriptional regulator with XRE-family HTH domain
MHQNTTLMLYIVKLFFFMLMPILFIFLDFISYYSYFLSTFSVLLLYQDGDMTFGERLKQLRNGQGISQSELASITGLHYTQIGRYEKGKSLPAQEVLRKLADLFSVSIDFLVEGSSEDSAKVHIHDRSLLKQFTEIETLDEKDKEVVKTLLDAFLTKKHIQELAK